MLILRSAILKNDILIKSPNRGGGGPAGNNQSEGGSGRTFPPSHFVSDQANCPFPSHHTFLCHQRGNDPVSHRSLSSPGKPTQLHSNFFDPLSFKDVYDHRTLNQQREHFLSIELVSIRVCTLKARHGSLMNASLLLPIHCLQTHLKMSEWG